MRGYPQFSFWISIEVVKIYISCIITHRGKKYLLLVGTVLKKKTIASACNILLSCVPKLTHLHLMKIVWILYKSLSQLLNHCCCTCRTIFLLTLILFCLQRLIRLSGEVKAAPSENEEIQFLCVVCAKLRQDPYLVNFFLEVSKMQSKYSSQFYINFACVIYWVGDNLLVR